MVSFDVYTRSTRVEKKKKKKNIYTFFSLFLFLDSICYFESIFTFCFADSFFSSLLSSSSSLNMDDTNETSFVVDEVSNVIKESIEATIGSQSYQQSKINTWTSNIVESILNSLTKLNKPFKYIVSCVIMQKNGAGLHTASSCFWDNTTDGSCTVR